MNLRCPVCDSRHIVERRPARRIVGVAGALAGAVASALSTLGGAEAGMAVGALAGPVGALVGTACGAVLAALSGGMSGCLVGARLGEAIDAHLIDAHECLVCHHRFRPIASRTAARQDYGSYDDYSADLWPACPRCAGMDE